MRISILIVMLTFLFSISSVGQQKKDGTISDLSLNYVKRIVNGNYEQNYALMDAQIPMDSVARIFDDLRYRVMSEFDKNASLKSLGHNQAVVLLGKVNKGISSNSVSYVQIEDQHRFSVFRIDFNQEHKIVGVSMLREIYAKPDNRRLWLVGIPIMILVLSFNIFVIVKVYRSSVTRKWAKYLMIVFLNFPVIGCHAMSGFFFNILSLRLLGISFASGDYFNTYWSIGLPLGAIIVLWRLKNNLYRTQEDNWIYEVEQGDVSGQSGEEGASRQA